MWLLVIHHVKKISKPDNDMRYKTWKKNIKIAGVNSEQKYLKSRGYDTNKIMQ